MELPGQNDIFHPDEERIGRTYEEENYNPAWRWLYAHDYYIQAKQARADGETFIIPPDEDETIIELFSYLHQNAPKNLKRVLWARNVLRRAATLKSAIIKALVVAKATNEDIAKCVKTQPDFVQFYLDCFFDVRQYLDVESFIQQEIFPTYGEKGYDSMNDTEIWSAIYLNIGYNQGLKALKDCITNRTVYSRTELEDLVMQIQCQSARSAINYTGTYRIQGVPRPHMLSKFESLALSMAQTKMADAGSQALNHVAWLKAIHGTVMEKAEKGDFAENIILFKRQQSEESHVSEWKYLDGKKNRPGASSKPPHFGNESSRKFGKGSV